MVNTLKQIMLFFFIMPSQMLIGKGLSSPIDSSEYFLSTKTVFSFSEKICYSDKLDLINIIHTDLRLVDDGNAEIGNNSKNYNYGNISTFDFSNTMRYIGNIDKAKREDKLKKMNKWMTGSIGLSFSTYHSQTSLASERQTLDPFNYRFFANVTVKVSDKFSLPFSISFAKKQFNTVIPQIPNQKPWDYIRDPRNNFGFHPTLDWGEFHIGTHTPKFSELTTGNTPIFGVGFDFTPGIFKFAASYGYTNIQVEHDIENNIRGQYLRSIFAAQVGFQKPKWHALINIVKADDKVKSIDDDLKRTKPEENFVLSTDFKFTLFDHLTFQTEVAASAFTANKQDEPLTLGGDAPNLPSWLITLTQSSRMDISGIAALKIDYPKFGISLDAKRLGTGFKSLAYPYFQTDYMDFTGSVRFGILKNKVNISGTSGYRLDNLSNTKISTSYRLIYSGNVVAMPIDKLSLVFNFSNFGENNSIDNDTLKVNYVSLSYGSNASYSFETGPLKNVVTFSYARSNYRDLNVVTGSERDNKTNNYAFMLASNYNDLRSTVMFSQTINRLPEGSIKVAVLSLGVNYKFEEPKMSLGLRVSYSGNTLFGYSPDHQITLSPVLSWEIAKRTKFNFNGNLRLAKYGERRDYANKNEQRFTMTMVQSF